MMFADTIYGCYATNHWHARLGAKNPFPLPQMYINVNFTVYLLMHKSKHSALIVIAQENKMVKKNL